MIEIHGWATIRESYTEEGEDDERLAKIIAELTVKLENYPARYDNMNIDCLTLNGSHHLTVTANTNHKDGRWHFVHDLFKWLSEQAPGSYGILTCHDDEDQNGLENEFQIFLLKKGNFVRSKDALLSPYFPTVEES